MKQISSTAHLWANYLDHKILLVWFFFSNGDNYNRGIILKLK